MLQPAGDPPHTAYLALGSNLASQYGGPVATLSAAVIRLGELGRVTALSGLYETIPVGYRDQPVFLNATLALETQLEPGELLEKMLALERAFGRKREPGAVKGPRTLDLDLLLFGDLLIGRTGMTVPHPELARRRFVLAPLKEIAPHLRPPGFDHTVAELLALLPDEGDNRISAVRRTHSPARGNNSELWTEN